MAVMMDPLKERVGWASWNPVSGVFLAPIIAAKPLMAFCAVGSRDSALGDLSQRENSRYVLYRAT